MNAGAHTPPDMALALLRGGMDAAMAQIRAQLEAVAAGQEPQDFEPPEASAFQHLGTMFKLTPSELALVALAASVELDPAATQAVRKVNETGVLDVALAERLLGASVWDALVPEAPLRHWRILETRGAGPLHTRTVHLDERILHALLGTHYLDTRLEGLVRPIWQDTALGPRETELADRIRQAWTNTAAPPVILLGGRDKDSKRALAASAVQTLGLRLLRVGAADIPDDWVQRSAIAVFLDREIALSQAALLIEGTDARAALMADLITGPTIVSSPDPGLPERTPVLRLSLAEADRTERRDQWHAALGDRAHATGRELDRISAQFALSTSAIHAAISEIDPSLAPAETGPALWRAARNQGRRALDGLADRIASNATWDDLVLPADQMAVLKDLAGHLRDAWVVNQDWGWAAKSARGLGAAALFAGASGTGKTLAAEVLAGVLNLDLYRIDLSQIVSKYIGETEKNLARIFSAAEDGGAILLFDEADALFGKRSEVKDSHDRYANVEVSYLLQRMEAYSGLAVLTTNQKSAVDTAFLRRLRYVLNFPFPGPKARAEIWARVFPEKTPLADVDPHALSHLNITGGSIRSIALNAAYLAAAEGEAVHMAHIRRAARREYAKLEKPMTNAELGRL